MDSAYFFLITLSPFYHRSMIHPSMMTDRRFRDPIKKDANLDPLQGDCQNSNFGWRAHEEHSHASSWHSFRYSMYPFFGPYSCSISLFYSSWPWNDKSCTCTSTNTFPSVLEKSNERMREQKLECLPVDPWKDGKNTLKRLVSLLNPTLHCIAMGCLRVGVWMWVVLSKEKHNIQRVTATFHHHLERAKMYFWSIASEIVRVRKINIGILRYRIDHKQCTIKILNMISTLRVNCDSYLFPIISSTRRQHETAPWSIHVWDYEWWMPANRFLELQNYLTYWVISSIFWRKNGNAQSTIPYRIDLGAIFSVSLSTSQCGRHGLEVFSKCM